MIEALLAALAGLGILIIALLAGVLVFGVWNACLRYSKMSNAELEGRKMARKKKRNTNKVSK